MYNRLHTIPACDGRTDRQTDRQTSCHGIVRAMHTRSAVKPKKNAKTETHLEYICRRRAGTCRPSSCEDRDIWSRCWWQRLDMIRRCYKSLSCRLDSLLCPCCRECLLRGSLEFHWSPAGLYTLTLHHHRYHHHHHHHHQSFPGIMRYGIVGFNVPFDTIGHFEDDFMGHITQPTVS